MESSTECSLQNPTKTQITKKGKVMKKAIFLALVAVSFLLGTTAFATSESLVKKGHRGQAVRTVQKALGLNPTGNFGKKTDQAVRKYQKEKGLRIDGIVGPKTRGSLFTSKMEDGSKSEPESETEPESELEYDSKADRTASWWDVTLRQFDKITKVTKIERHTEKAQQKYAHGDVINFLARTTWYNKKECTHRWLTKKLPNGKKTRVYVDTDPWTKKGLTCTGAPLVKVGTNRAGSIAVDPKIIPYGSKVMLVTKNGPEFYVACDTGCAVVSRRAARRSARTPEQARAIVVDCFRDHEPGTYLNIKVSPYKGETPFRKLHRSEQMDHFNLEFAKAPFMRANLG